MPQSNETLTLLAAELSSAAMRGPRLRLQRIVITPFVPFT